ncbi:hypothetical protein J4E91_002654 [Alternaria rosae]|nr:hypothetical protein J4E91_002654 [Alternaria rosae]
MGPRRPSSATDVDSRMPFASAEALLWGPEMKQQHAHLLTEMRTLQKHHEEYEARIRSTEHVAEAAEAATSRVRHLEQQLAAIEAEDDDKAFEKWAAGEMTRLGIFVDTNKHVRQKQIELDGIVSHAVDDLDKLRQVPRALKGVLRRLDLLESGRNQDARRIESLEEEVTRLKSTRQDATSKSNTAGPQTVSRPQQGSLRSMTPSRLLDAEIADATSDTDDEDLILMPGFETSRYVHFRSKRIQEQEAEERKPHVTGIESLLPPTQLVEPALSSRKKQKTVHDQGLDDIKTKFITPIRPTTRAPATTKRNAAVGKSKNTAVEPTQLVTRSPAKSNIPKATIPPAKRRNPSPVRPSAVKEEQQNSLVVILRSPQKATGIDRSESDDMRTTVADRAKMSPRKVAAAPLSRSKAIPKPSSTRIPGGRSKPGVGSLAKILASFGRK